MDPIDDEDVVHEAALRQLLGGMSDDEVDELSAAADEAQGASEQ